MNDINKGKRKGKARREGTRQGKGQGTGREGQDLLSLAFKEKGGAGRRKDWSFLHKN